MVTVVRDSNDAIMISDFEGRITAWNRGAELMYGYSEEDALQMTLWQITPSKKVAEKKEFIHRLIAGETINSFETQRVTKDGRILDVWMTVTKLVDDAGKPVGIASTERDITGRKRVEDVLRESEQKYRNLVDNANEAILVVQEGTVKFVNRRAVEVAGYPGPDIMGKHFPDFICPDDRQMVVDNYVKRMKGEPVPKKYEFRLISIDGNPKWVEINTVLIDWKGRPAALSFLTDISDRKEAEAKREELEAQLRQSQKLEVIGQLSGGVAHDFNNLLGVIMGYAELMKMNRDTAVDVERYVPKIISACARGAALTRQLLTFARKVPIEFINVDLKNIIKNVLEIIKQTIDRRIEIVLDMQEQPAVVSGDWSQLENAFLNIAINARDAMPEGGRLSITVKTVEPSQVVLPEKDSKAVQGPYVRISIADTGTGMSREVKEHIFEPFFTTKEVGKGTGLGLASVYGCIKQHFGQITLESQEGKGTEFTIYLPAIISAKAIERTKEAAALLPGTGTLLVVDDETTFHEILKEILGSLGYTVHCCADGAEAVEFYREHTSTIDVVILDINMPKMNGLQCFKHLKEINPRVKVIVTSGYGYGSELEAMQKEGVCAFVHKPYRTAELAKKIAEVAAS